MAELCIGESCNGQLYTKDICSSQKVFEIVAKRVNKVKVAGDFAEAVISIEKK